MPLAYYTSTSASAFINTAETSTPAVFWLCSPAVSHPAYWSLPSDCTSDTGSAFAHGFDEDIAVSANESALFRQILLSSVKIVIDAWRFFGAHSHLSLGRGVIYEGIRYPVFDPSTSKFLTVEGTIYVLTHECDVSQENSRPFNDDVLICPLMPFNAFSDRYQQAYSQENLKNFLASLVWRRTGYRA